MDENKVNGWGLRLATRTIIDAVALEYDGYAIKRYLFPKKGDMACCMDGVEGNQWPNYELNRDRYFLRSQLFAYQRYFGKWGGERVPEYDLEYSKWYFIYLQCYRVKLPTLFKMHEESWTRNAERREEAAADLRKCFADLGKNDLDGLPEDEFKAALLGDFTAACERGLNQWVLQRPTVMLANACNDDMILRLLDKWEHDPLDERPRSKLNPEKAIDAFKQYTSRGIVHEDDNINRLIYKMLQWFLTTHPGHANYTTRSHILYALMYLHLYRTEFSRFAGIPDRVKAWSEDDWEFKEHWASQFRKHLSVLREAKSLLGGES